MPEDRGHRTRRPSRAVLLTCALVLAHAAAAQSPGRSPGGFTWPGGPNGAIRMPVAPPGRPLPEGDFTRTWGERLPEDVPQLTVSGRDGNRACTLTLGYFAAIENQRQYGKDLERDLERATFFATSANALMERERWNGKIAWANLDCVVAPSEREQRAMEKARREQEQRREQ